MPFANVNGIELYYEEHGEGPALIFAHGAGGNHLSWWQQVVAFAKQFRCVTFDHRGFGFSRETPHGPGPKAFADDLRGLLDHLKIDRAALVSQSMGGWTSLGFAVAAPERVSALALCDTMAGVDDPEVVEEMKLHGAPKGGLAQVLTRVYAEDYPQREPAKAFLYRQISSLNLHVPPDLVPAMMNLRHRVDALLEKRVPTMILVGEQDALTTPRLMEVIARRIPHARFIKVPGAGHSVYFEKPEQFNRALADFLRDAGAANR
ncbi:MAG TPA: alpha/beta fold hydrolase [Candidatus Binataceae bacterium]|nr:alpha/beta fold hydrolase [Candidatus Binataceae bacterium]